MYVNIKITLKKLIKYQQVSLKTLNFSVSFPWEKYSPYFLAAKVDGFECEGR